MATTRVCTTLRGWRPSCRPITRCDRSDSESKKRWRRLTVTASESTGDLREPLAALLAKAGGVVRELRREAPSLEHLFVQMIAEAEADAAQRSHRHAESLAGAAA